MIDVLRKEAVKQGEVALAEELQIGKAFQITAHGLERQPAALHLQLKGFFLPGEEGLQSQCPALLAGEGRALVEQGIVEQLFPPQGGDQGGGSQGMQGAQCPVSQPAGLDERLGLGGRGR